MSGSYKSWQIYAIECNENDELPLQLSIRRKRKDHNIIFIF